MSSVCDFSSVCPRTSTQRLLKATLRAAAAVAAQNHLEVTCGGDEKEGGGGDDDGGSNNCPGLMCAGSDTGGRCGAAVAVSHSATAMANSSSTSSSSSSSAAAPSAFKCPRCPRAYALSYTLERHMKYECGVAKQFGCFKCGKRFSRKDILKAHISNTKSHCAAAAAAVFAAATGFESS